MNEGFREGVGMEKKTLCLRGFRFRPSQSEASYGSA